MHYLVATDSVHTTAAACDYLEGRLAADDTVTVLSLPEVGDRDAGDAINVAEVRLVGEWTVETVQPDPDPDTATAILAAADDRDADVVLVGPHAGAPESGPALGGTTRRVIEGVDVPVVVVPLSL